MTQNPKNRRIHLTRGRRDAPKEISHEIPVGAKREIRRLIEEEGSNSTTEIAKSLNRDGYPCAQAEEWDARLVDSALRRQDMTDLKEKLRENRAEDVPAGPSSLEIKQAAYNGAKEAVDKLKLTVPEIPPLKVDTFTIKGAVADAVQKALDDHRRRADADAGQTADVIVSRLKEGLRITVPDPDLVSLRRVTDATGRNVGDILKRIDLVCEDLHETITSTLKEHSKAVIDACEEMGATLYERVDQRFDKLEANLVERLVADGGLDLSKTLSEIIDSRLKAQSDETLNRFALMVGNLKRDLMGGKYSHGKY